MNLDERAQRARESLRRRVEPDLDLHDARNRLDDHHARRRSDQRRARVAAVGISALALLAGVAIVTSSSPSSPDGRPDPTQELAVDDPDSEILSDEEMIEAMPLGPTDGKESWRLPVGVSPQTGLQDGQTVRIYGRGFFPDDYLGVVHCASEADTDNAGVDACELGADNGFSGVEYVYANHNGDVMADITVRRYIDTPGYGRIDCASAPERCLLGMGAVSDYDRSGGVYINFAGAPEFPAPTFTVGADPSALTPGQEVQVDVTNWVPHRQLRIEQCAMGADGLDGTERCQPLLDTRADAAGSFSGLVVVNAEVVDADGTVACDGGCVLRANGIGIPEGTTAPLPDAVVIAFVDGGDLTTTTHQSTTTTPPPVEGNPANPVDPEGEAGQGAPDPG